MTPTMGVPLSSGNVSPSTNGCPHKNYNKSKQMTLQLRISGKIHGNRVHTSFASVTTSKAMSPQCLRYLSVMVNYLCLFGTCNNCTSIYDTIANKNVADHSCYFLYRQMRENINALGQPLLIQNQSCMKDSGIQSKMNF